MECLITAKTSNISSGIYLDYFQLRSSNMVEFWMIRHELQYVWLVNTATILRLLSRVSSSHLGLALRRTSLISFSYCLSGARGWHRNQYEIQSVSSTKSISFLQMIVRWCKLL